MAIFKKDKMTKGQSGKISLGRIKTNDHLDSPTAVAVVASDSVFVGYADDKEHKLDYHQLLW